MLPTLSTTRLLLRPASEDDVGTLWSLWTDAHVRRYLWDDRTITRDEAHATLSDCLALVPQGLGLWTLHASLGPDAPPSGVDACIGCAGLLPVSTASDYDTRLTGLVEPLVALAPRAWGKGFASEALQALLQHASVTLALPRLAGVTDVPNVASDRMLRHAGFHVLGEVQGPRYPLRTYLWEAPSRTISQGRSGPDAP